MKRTVISFLLSCLVLAGFAQTKSNEIEKDTLYRGSILQQYLGSNEGFKS